MTDRRVYRYRVPLTDDVVLELPTSARFLSVGPPRDRRDELDLWAIVEHGDHTSTAHRLHVVGTGNPMPEGAGQFIGTAPSHGGQLIWHVFDGGPA